MAMNLVEYVELQTRTSNRFIHHKQTPVQCRKGVFSTSYRLPDSLVADPWQRLGQIDSHGEPGSLCMTGLNLRTSNHESR